MSEVQNAWWFIWNSLCCSILEPITHTDVAQGAYFTAMGSVLVKRREAVGRWKETTGRGWVLKASMWMACVCWVGTVEGHVGTESGKGHLVARKSRRWALSENRKYPSCWQLQGTVWGPLRLGRTLWVIFCQEQSHGCGNQKHVFEEMAPHIWGSFYTSFSWKKV